MRSLLVNLALALAVAALLAAFVVWQDSIKFLAPWGPWVGALVTFMAVLVALKLHTNMVVRQVN